MDPEVQQDLMYSPTVLIISSVANIFFVVCFLFLD
jgi:hypothetical protein